MISAALLGAVTLPGCKSDGNMPYTAGKATAPIPPKLLADISDKNMEVSSPILVRVFKTESELEVWKQDRTGRYALLKTYPICKWSGDLGPKVREGDRQAPEGFYNITPAQMNPNDQARRAVKGSPWARPMQKLIVGREMSSEPSVLIASHPTRGVDVGAQAAIWDLLRDARAKGLAVLLISADLDELIGLSDTIKVMLRGKLVADADPATVTPEQLGSAMTGAGGAS